MMKFATILALLTLAFVVNSAAMPYNEFMAPKVMLNEEPPYPEVKQGDSTERPMNQFWQKIGKHTEEESANAVSPMNNSGIEQ